MASLGRPPLTIGPAHADLHVTETGQSEVGRSMMSADGNHHDAYRFNNHRQMAAAMMSPSMGAGPEGFNPAMMAGPPPFADPMAFAMGAHMAVALPSWPG